MTYYGKAKTNEIPAICLRLARRDDYKPNDTGENIVIKPDNEEEKVNEEEPAL